MSTYRYKAVTATGTVVEGEMEAASQAAVIQQLHDSGHVPVRAEEVKRSAGTSWLSRDIGGRVKLRDVAILTRELATLLEAGLPLDRALEIIITVSENDRLRKRLVRVLEQVRGGAPLSRAMEENKDIFPNYYVSLVRAGEQGGALEAVLERLADFVEKSVAIRENVTSALIYPAILVVMAILSIILMLGFVIPQLKPLFEDAGQALPVSTQIIIGLGELVQHYWWAMAAFVAGAAVILRSQIRTPAGRLAWHGFLLRLPLFGDLLRKTEIARFSRTLGTLLGNGVAVLSALAIVADTLTNTVIARAVREAAVQVKEGRRLAEPLMTARVFPPLAIHMVRVGEETGQLHDMLLKVADIYDREVQRSVERLLALLVPVLTVGLGALVAGIILSVLSAILSVNRLGL